MSKLVEYLYELYMDACDCIVSNRYRLVCVVQFTECLYLHARMPPMIKIIYLHGYLPLRSGYIYIYIYTHIYIWVEDV